MKANKTEFRLGNYALDNGELTIVDFIHYHAIKGRIAILELEGVELTPEWLGWAGFENNKTLIKWMELGEFALKPIDDYWVFYSSIHHVDIKYVHTLQNLYHSLYHEELTFKTTAKV